MKKKKTYCVDVTNQSCELFLAGNVYVNHWESKTYMTSVEDTSLRGGGYKLKNEIWESVREIIEQWTGMEQRPISMYGIRSYKRGAVLSPHVDRLPLVSSCIINVAQDVEEEWPLEVYDRHDRAVNVTMIPGDMVLYESGSLMHGRLLFFVVAVMKTRHSDILTFFSFILCFQDGHFLSRVTFSPTFSSILSQQAAN